MATATLDKAYQNISDVRKKTAGMESRRENEPEQIIARDLFARFHSMGGRWTLNTEGETLKIVEMVCGIIVERGWRIHKDYPVCHECREKVNERKAAAKHWGETQGREIAHQMIEANRANSVESGE